MKNKFPIAILKQGEFNDGLGYGIYDVIYSDGSRNTHHLRDVSSLSEYEIQDMISIIKKENEIANTEKGLEAIKIVENQ